MYILKLKSSPQKTARRQKQRLSHVKSLGVESAQIPALRAAWQQNERQPKWEYINSSDALSVI